MSRNDSVSAQSSLMSAIYGQSEGQAFEAQGLAVYRRSLAANAKRALEVSFPTVYQLVGDDCFTLLSNHFLHVHPLAVGDWGEWGSELPAWIATNADFDEVPYLGDCAQLDWLCHQCERAADISADLASLSLLTEHDTYQLSMQFCSGAALLPSQHPVVDIWNAHHTSSDEDLFAQASNSITNQNSQTALIWRPEWKAQVSLLCPAEQLWLQRTLAGQSIGAALDEVGNTNFSFETWLPQAIQSGLLRGIKSLKNN